MSIKSKLEKAGSVTFIVYAIVAAFGTYACMIAFRRPFTIGIYEGIKFFGIDYKITLVISQLLGYMLAKFYGIKFISEMPKAKRAFSLILMIVIAEASLVLFAIVPVPYNIIFMFFNGITLGMIWGLVFSYVEGRKVTEILGAGLSASFIVTSGFVKTIGKVLVENFGISEFNMPYLTGLIFFIPYILFVLMLNQLPEPDEKDIDLKTKRIQMTPEDRKKFFKKFAVGLIILTFIYLMFTAYKDFRESFLANIWKELGYGNQSAIFTTTEIYVTLGVLGMLSMIMLIKNNFMALMANHIALFIGIVSIGLGTYLFQREIISPYFWILLTGFGAFMGYVPFNAFLFDRLIATFRHESNSGYLIYFADSFAYLASITVMLIKNFGAPAQSNVVYFENAGYVIFVLGIIFIGISVKYFYGKNKEIIIDKNL